MQRLTVLSLLTLASGALAAPQAAPAAASAAPEAAASAPCPHPFFPMENGLKLTVRAGRSELKLEWSDVTGVKAPAAPAEGAVAGALQEGTLKVHYKDRTGDTRATCGAEGVSTGLGGLEGMLLSASGMQVEVLKSEGVVMPPPAELTPGKSWKNSLSVRMTPPESASAKMGGFKATLSSTLDKEATVVGTEQVTVAAGTFEALRVKNLTQMRSSANRPPRTVESTLWFAKGIGLIKVQTGDSVDLELLAVERPGAKPVVAGKAPAKKAKAPQQAQP